MARRPGIPLQFDLAAGSDLRNGLARGGAQVADDIVGSGGAGGDEAVAQVLRVRPADHRGRSGLVLEGWVVALVVGAVDDGSGDVAVGVHRCGHGAEDGCGLKERHLVG